MVVLEILKDMTLTILIAVTLVNIKEDRTSDVISRLMKVLFIAILFTL